MQSSDIESEQKAVSERVNLLGLPFDAVTLEQAAIQLNDCITHHQRCFLSTPNLNFTIMAQDDAAFYKSVIQSDLVVADGMPLIWVAKMLGLPITERVAGSDLFAYLSNQPRANKLRVFFFGGETGIAEKAHFALNQQSPGMVSCGYYDPGFVSIDAMSTTEIVDYINSCVPDFIVVALGAKKGQQWIMRNRHQLEAPVISHLGAVINFVAGNVKRAPEQWQRFGLEWLWRIKQEPKLYKRYLNDGLRFLAMLISQALPLMFRMRKHAKSSKDYYLNKSITFIRNNTEIKLEGMLTRQTFPELESDLMALLEKKHDVSLNMQQVTYIDQYVIADLMHFQERLKDNNKSLTLKNISLEVKSILAESSVLKRFRLL